MISVRSFALSIAVPAFMMAGAVGCNSTAPAPASAPPASAPAVEATPLSAAPAPAAAPAAPAAAAVPGPANAGTPKKGGAFVKSQSGDPPTFDVHSTSLGVLTDHTRLTHSRLTRFQYGTDPGAMVVVGDLAEKWDFSPDAKIWNFTLRKGVKFHNVAPVNGRELVADDIVYSYNRLKTAKSSIWQGQYEYIDKIEAVDKYTVKFTLKVPNASMLFRTSDGEAAWIVAKEVAEKPDYGKTPQGSLIGTGPFLFVSYDNGVALKEKKNPDYFGSGFSGVPFIDSSESLIMNDASARTAAFLSKQIDTNTATKADLDKIKASMPAVVPILNKITQTSSGMIINTTKAPFDNVKVRQALKYGVSQQGIIDGLYKGDGSWSGFMPNGLGNWKLDDAEVKQLYKYDPEMAKKLLAEAGFASGISAKFLVFTGYQQNYIDTAEVMVADLKKVGINLTIDLQPLAAGRKSVEDGNFSLNNSAHITGVEPDEFAKDGLVPGGSRNFFRLDDKTINDLAAKQTVIVDVKERKKLIDEIFRRVAELVPLVPIPNQWSYRVSQPYLKNYFPDPIVTDEPVETFLWLEK